MTVALRVGEALTMARGKGEGCMRNADSSAHGSKRSHSDTSAQRLSAPLNFGKCLLLHGVGWHAGSNCKACFMRIA